MAQQQQQQDQLTATPNVINVFRANPGLIFSADQVRAINAGTLVLVGPAVTFPGGIVAPPGGGSRLKDFGCIKSLRYGDNDKDLTYVEFDGGDKLGVPGKAFPENAINLNDFRERLQEAANFGHGVSACHDTVSKKISMLNLYPCECTCDKREQPVIT